MNNMIIAAPCCGSCDLRYVVTGEDHGICPKFFKLTGVCEEYQPLNPVEVGSETELLNFINELSREHLAYKKQKGMDV